MHCIGGYHGRRLDQILRYNPTEDTWTEAGQLTEAKYYHSSATVHISGLEGIMKDIKEKVYESNNKIEDVHGKVNDVHVKVYENSDKIEDVHGKVNDVHQKVEDIKDLVKQEGKDLT